MIPRMKRTKPIHNRPTAILTGDWHLRETQPIARTDDFWEAQWDKVQQIKELQEKYDCPVWMAGDLFHHWKPSPYLLTETISRLPARMNVVAGNHDLPQHNMDLLHKSGLQTLVKAGAVTLLEGTHWGEEPFHGTFLIPSVTHDKVIAVWHVMTYVGEKPWPGCTDLNARQILEKYPQFALILTGHNHKTFVKEIDGRLLVNPGSLTRQTTDQINHKPCVFLWYAEDNTVKQVFLKIKPGVISREHLERAEKRDARITAFVERLTGSWKSTVSFEDNLERFRQNNQVRSSVMDIVYKSID